MPKKLVGSVPGEALGMLADLALKMKANPQLWVPRLEAMLHGKSLTAMSADMKALVSRTQRMLRKRFGTSISVPATPKEFTDENLAYWATCNYYPVYLPNEEIGEDRKLKGWVKLSHWFYERVRDGKIKPFSNFLSPTQLPGRWCLADYTVASDYTDGSQVFVDDRLASVFAELREKKLVGKHSNTPMGSRYSITPIEWRDVVLAHVASKLRVTRAQMILEPAGYFNAIGNLYDPNRGKFNSWEWFEDDCGDSRRLYGGSRGCGGLADVDYFSADSRSVLIAARPLVCF